MTTALSPMRIVELLGLFSRSLSLDAAASRACPRDANLILYEANDLRARVLEGTGRLACDCTTSLERAIGQLPPEYSWLTKTIGCYPAHYAEDHHCELNARQYELLMGIPLYFR